MLRQEQGQQRAPLPLEAVAGGVYGHALFAGPNARRRQDAAANIDHAEAAHANGVQPGIVAEDRNVDAGLPGGIPDGGPGRDADGLAIDG